MSREKIVGYSPGSVDPRMMVDILGSTPMRREFQGGQAYQYAQKGPERDEARQKTIGSLTEKQRDVYEAITGGVDTQQLDVATGLSQEDINQAVKDLTNLGLLKEYSVEEASSSALGRMDEARRRGQDYQGLKKEAALAFARAGNVGALRTTFGAGSFQDFKTKYLGGSISYNDLLTARGIASKYGTSFIFPEKGWRQVKEIKSSYDTWIKDAPVGGRSEWTKYWETEVVPKW